MTIIFLITHKLQLKANVKNPKISSVHATPAGIAALNRFMLKFDNRLQDYIKPKAVTQSYLRARITPYKLLTYSV
jgi:hypothetical protein